LALSDGLPDLRRDGRDALSRANRGAYAYPRSALWRLWTRVGNLRAVTVVIP